MAISSESPLLSEQNRTKYFQSGHLLSRQRSANPEPAAPKPQPLRLQKRSRSRNRLALDLGYRVAKANIYMNKTYRHGQCLSAAFSQRKRPSLSILPRCLAKHGFTLGVWCPCAFPSWGSRFVTWSSMSTLNTGIKRIVANRY